MSTEAGCTIQLGGKQSNAFQRNIETVISEAVDSSLSLFGTTFKMIVYAELETKFQIKKQEIPNRINDFANAIEEICGVGAKLIEMRIVQALHEKVQGFIYVPSGEDLMFTEYVESLRQFP